MKKASERQAWETLRVEIPWLNKSHRQLVAIRPVSMAATLLARN
jgi:hypothetical protein